MSKKQKKNLIRVISSAVLLAVIWALPLEGVWRLLVFLVPYAVIGYDVLFSAVRNIFHGQIFDENFLWQIIRKPLRSCCFIKSVNCSKASLSAKAESRLRL